MSGHVVVAAEQLRRRVPGGIGRYAAGLLGGLRQVGGVPVEVLASRHPGAAPDPLGAWGFPVRCSVLPSPLLTAAWDLGLAPVRDGRLVHSVSLAAPPVRPTRGRGGPALVVTVHDLAWRAYPDATTRRGRRWHEAALGRVLGRADGFVVPSAPVAAELADAGADPARVRVIAHGADHLPAPDTAGATSLLARLGVHGGYLLAAATLEPRKNLRRLLAAFARARPSLGGLTLVVVGPHGWGETDPVGAAAHADGAVAAGAVDDGVLAALYRGARAFAYVPLTEGFGLPPVEAMACGAPVVVSTTVPSVAPSDPRPEVGDAALRVDPFTVDGIADALFRASTDEGLRATLVANGRALVAPLTWEAAAAAHVAWWETRS
jgi:glycosyltransferase involved in cell wall biosynthesis